MNLTRLLRKHMNKLLWVLVIFIAIAFGVSYTMRDVIMMWFSSPWARMFSREVGSGEFSNAKRRLSALSGTDRLPDDEVWEHLAMIEEARRTGVVVGHLELQEEILKTYREMRLVEEMNNSSSSQEEYRQKLMGYWRLSPPQRKARLEAIQFSDLAYSKLIFERYRMSAPEFEETYHELLLINKLRSFVSGSAVVSSQSVYDNIVEENQQRKIDYIHIDSENYADRVEMEEEALNKFYKEREGDYKESARIAFEYVMARYDDMKETLPPPSEDELKDFYERKKHLHFWDSRPRTPGAEGVSTPQEQYKPYDRVRLEVRTLYLQDQSDKKARELVDKVRGKVNVLEEITLLGAAGIAAGEGLRAGETKPFSYYELWKLEDEFGRCLHARRMFDYARNVEELSRGEFQGPYESDKGIFVYRISKHFPEHTKPLDEVRPGVEKAFTNKRAGELAREDAERIIKEARESEAFTDELISKENLARISTGFFKTFMNEGDIKTIQGNDADVINASFKIEKTNGFAEPVAVDVAGKMHYYLVQYKGRLEPNPSEFLGKRQDLLDTTRSEGESEVFEEWKKDLIRRAEIKKYYEGSGESSEEKPEGRPEGGEPGQPAQEQRDA